MLTSTKPWSYSLNPGIFYYNAEYISPQQRAANRQAAIDIGAIAPSTPLDAEATSSPPPKGTYG